VILRMASPGGFVMARLRHLTFAGALLLFGAAAPAHAVLTSNSLTSNALTNNALASNALSSNALSTNALSGNALAANALAGNALAANALVTTGSAIADLNGVTVEGITLPPATHR